MSRILAIDYGIRRIGIAATDPEQIIASPVTTLAPNKLFSFLEQYVQDESVEQIVVGHPTKEDGTPTDLTKAVEILVVKLKSRFPKINISLHDERYTSKLAKQSMIYSGSSRKSRRNKSNIDQISATLILQSFMEEKKITQ